MILLANKGFGVSLVDRLFEESLGEAPEMSKDCRKFKLFALTKKEWHYFMQKEWYRGNFMILFRLLFYIRGGFLYFTGNIKEE